MEGYQPVWLREWKGPEQNAIDHGKHDGGCADSEAEDQQSNPDEARLLTEGAESVADILQELLGPASATSIAT
jgi:hypothetical protein